MQKPIVLIGAGGHAKSVIEAIGCNRQVLGYVDGCDRRLPVTYLGNDDTFIAGKASDKQELLITMVAGRACSMRPRSMLIKKYDGYDFAKVIASTAYVADSAVIANGCVVMHKCFVNVDSKIGKHCVLNTSSVIEHDCCIGDNTFIGPGAVVCGGVTIGNNVYIGANSTIRPGITICDDVTLGLGAAVVENITEPGTYVGIPAKRLDR